MTKTESCESRGRDLPPHILGGGGEKEVYKRKSSRTTRESKSVIVWEGNHMMRVSKGIELSCLFYNRR